MSNELTEKTKPLTSWAFAVLGITLMCYVANAFLGMLNQDEGWILYAAREVMRGDLPHRDFFFTQGKLMPIVYACFGWLWSAFGVLGGRLFTALLSLSALLVADRAIVSCCVRLEERKLVRLVFFSFLGINLWYTYFTCIPKTYGLCTLGIAIGLRLLTGLREKGGIDLWCVLSAGCVFAGLADVRLSMGVLVPAIGGWLFWQRAWAGRWNWAWFLLAAGVTWCLLFLPEILLWKSAFVEAYAFHAQREPMGFVGIIGCLARLCRFNPLLVTVGGLILWLAITKKPSLRSLTESRAPFLQLWTVCAVALIGVHLMAPVPYDDYLLPALLPLAMAEAFAFSRLPFDSMRMALAKVFVLLSCLLTIGASPIAQDWFVSGKDRFWVNFKEKPDLFLLWDVAEVVRAEAQRLNEDTLWTQDTYLAVEAGLKVPCGMEMGPFSKPQPMTFAPKLAAWSGYTFALRYPMLSPTSDRAQKLQELQHVYALQILDVPRFGQGGTQLTVAERSEP